MARSLAAILLLAGLLSGCVLQSRAPLFGDRDSRLVFGEGQFQALMFGPRDGKWVPEDDRASLASKGTHYVASDGKKDEEIALAFVPLSGKWHVVQASDARNPAVYMFAEVNTGSADIYPLSCSALKSDSSLAKWIEFTGDDCFVNADAPRKTLFTALLARRGEATSRMEIMK